MNYLLLGTVSTLVEWQHVVANIKRPGTKRRRIREFTELVTLVIASDGDGGDAEAKRWRRTRHDGAVRLYSGDPRSGETCLWAAFAAETDGALTLLKVVDTYGGGDMEREGLLADALYRKEKGTVVRGTSP